MDKPVDNVDNLMCMCGLIELSLVIPISKYNYSRYLLIIIAIYVKITNERHL